MDKNKIIAHGSENSLDKDIFVIIEKPLNKKEAALLCKEYTEYNANLIVVDNGVVSWCYKGTPDECNNGILKTYALHKQEYENPIKYKLKRNHGLKLIRTLRGFLSYLSRTQYRGSVKEALVSSDLDKKINTLLSISLLDINDFQKTSIINGYKFFAFQLGQTLSLLEDNIELFTKNEVGNYYPQLKKYLNRESSTVNDLNDFYSSFLNKIHKNYIKKDDGVYEINIFGDKSTVDIKNEIIVHSEGDVGTLSNLKNEDFCKFVR